MSDASEAATGPAAEPARRVRERRLGGREAWLLFAAALVLRLLAIVALDSPSAARGASAWDWGGESACLAESLAEGGGYADPWGQGTGPSGWLTPVYPALLALLMSAFGGVTPATAAVLFVLQSAASAATCVVLAQLGVALRWPRAGRLAGWLLALYPPAIWNASQTVWDTTFVALGLTVFLWALIAAHRGRRAPSTSGVALLGLGYGALLFLNPAPLALWPALVLYLTLRRRRARRALRVGAVFTGFALLVCLPWMVRNQVALGSLALRPNFGVEMMIGNNERSIGRPQPWRFHPSHVAAELDLYRDLGEGPYAKHAAGRALDWMLKNPGDYALLTLRRIQFFWLGQWPPSDQRSEDGRTGAGDPKTWLKFVVFSLSGLGALLAMTRLDPSRPAQLLMVLGPLLFGVPYFLTHVSERYRFPIDPLILLLDAWILLRLWGTLRAPRSGGSP